MLAKVNVPNPNQAVSWNTVLISDRHGEFIATYWYGKPEWDSAIRVYDQNLQPVWGKTGLPSGRKSTLTYAEGKLLIGCGNHWDANYQGDDWKHVTAYKIGSGDEAWRCELPLKARQYVANLPYFNGCLYGESQSYDNTTPSQLFRINVGNGKLEDTITFDQGICSCAQTIIAHGKVFSGDLFGDGVAVTKIAENSSADWPGPFGDPQTNQMALPREASAQQVPLKEVGR